jgi:hypothetical protein
MIHMPGHKRGADRSRVIAKAPEPNSSSDRRAICRKEGEYWTIGYANKAIRLRDLKGIGHLANLLRHPGIEFHVLNLANGVLSQPPDSALSNLRRSLEPERQQYQHVDLRITGLGDAGEMLDAQAKNQYRRRLSDLRKESEEAKALGAVERAERVEFEISALTKELARAVGLNGRDRRAGSASERARQSLNKTIKVAIEKITELEPTIGGYLARTINTGTFCSYQPNPEFPVNWDVSTEINSETRHSNEGWTTARSNELPLKMLRLLPYSPSELTGFVGREVETRVIRAAIDRAANGCGSIVMVAGGPGIGKSRLAMTIRDYALSLGFQCLVGCCYEREEQQQLPYQPFVEIVEASIYQADSLDSYLHQVGHNGVELARLIPSLSSVFRDLAPPAEMEPAERRLYLFHSLTEMIGRLSQNASQLYVLEDLHWADESTLTLLIHLAKRIAQLPVVILGTYRNIFSEHSRALLRTLEELIRLSVRTLKLGALSKSQVIQLLGDLSGGQPPEPLVNLLLEKTQGNPFFLEQIYRQLLDDGKIFDETGEFRSDMNIDGTEIPDNVLLVITRWLAALTEHEKRVLAAAAVVGRSFNFQLLSALNQSNLDDLFSVIHKGQQMGILVASPQDSGMWYVFTNELVRQSLLSYVSASRYGSVNSVCNQYDRAIEPRHDQLLSRRNGGPPL